MNFVPSDLPIEIRSAEPQDYPFILTSWSNDAHKVKYENFIPNSIFFPRHKNFINNVLKQSLVSIAHIEDEPNLICGYLIIEPRFEIKTLLIHWAHTKPLYRKQGIFQALLDNYLQGADPIKVVTSPFELLPQFKKRYGIIFDPTHSDHLRIL